MAPHVALAGLSLSSMSTRLLMLVILLALVGLLLVKRMRDGRAAGDTEAEFDVESGDATDETEVAAEPAQVDPRSLAAQAPAAPAAQAAAPAAPVAAQAPAPPQPAPVPAMAGSAQAVATAQRPTQAQAQAPTQPQPVAAPVAPPAPQPPARPARPAGLFAPVPLGAVSAGGRAPGATIVPKF
jgi:FtsZ-interacting cell division protein ZipA